ncbi:CcdB family protein [Luteimonas sp. MC1825]|uniref:CcdB family protein n=1 Tax=Luteimonas sp. MC1825 TaxID=2761107 RepID=UPI001609777B|nr:CcdB family protein [Luteimonas sp. MC1825]MBB6599984.1 CcdB family protein [Luteimonas sp. MC1825]QOC87690.1 CcdB family protein [Luteimonas sp. MC1825]
MSQFCVYLNADVASRRSIPCWLNVQSDLIDTAESRVVVPLIAPERGRPSVASLMPTLTVAGRPLVMDTAQITNVPMQMLGRRLADLSADRLIIIGALDFLTHGI